MLRLPGPVDDAAHDRDRQVLDTGIARRPLGHASLDMALDALRHLLEERARRPSADRTGAELGAEGAQAERLQGLHRDTHLLAAVTTRLWGQRDTDGVADALVEEDGEGSR